MKRLNILLSISILAALLLSACGAAATPTAAPITLTDGLNRSITLAAPAQRIVSLAPSNTEILYAIGAGSQVVGRDDFSDYPTEASKLPSVGGNMGTYSLETIASLKPDLVLAAEINTPELVKSMQDLGLTVYYLSNPKDLDGMYANLKTVAQLAGRESEADALVSSLQKRVQAVKDAITPDAARVTVFYELDGTTDPTKPWTAGKDTFLSQLISMAGGSNIGDNLAGSYAQMSLEELLVQDPSILLLGDAAYGATPEQVAARTGWDALQAVKDNRIYTFDDDLVSRPGPRLVDGLETLAKLLHPELFK
ncbi:ABC-type Fe3+-hydroxamate transport system, periplasmic component [Longilinea arvoryzae]|uniref:ABC-type Fe3+-hydroxamate transport system, periplasmic component n=1 Tax=Longilinea arvoryzae TaxID=360412 RepID=A0A0S7BPT1_9CHLR|nr:cobalamin-binding protein [Longilinea arvoryzae]GAP15866.1 ABC-type Fe3+-hydroxamate transport system, periplasmic component [Longilinea arvoryzae]